jgi:hypothetical protein
MKNTAGSKFYGGSKTDGAINWSTLRSFLPGCLELCGLWRRKTSSDALYAAGLSTYNTIKSRIDLKSRIRVTLRQGLVGTSQSRPTDAFVATAINVGLRPVTLSKCVLAFPNDKQLTMPAFLGSDQLPAQITEGQRCIFPLREVVNQLKKEGFSGRGRVEPRAHRGKSL